MTRTPENSSDTISTKVLHLVVNGLPRRFPVGTTALDVVQDLGFEQRPIAVEVNERVIRRVELNACMLSDGDCLEIVTLVGGG